jgi:GNAT superfamily N-acetyltransferase
MNIVIKPLTLDLTSDYLDFFDKRAFSDGNPCGPCYCNAPIMDALSIRQMESEFGDDAKGVLRGYAVKQLAEEKIHGYLAFDADIPVGWCNAGNMDTYMINSFDFIPDTARQSACGKTMSVVCFAIAPGYRGKGIASALLERVVTDARAEGYAAVEGYAEILKEPVYYDFHGPVRLYENAGFSIVARADNRVIFRKVL